MDAQKDWYELLEMVQRNEIAGLRTKNERLNTTIIKMARWMKNNEDGRLPDHACQRCVPHSDVLIPGFDCAYHEAMDILNNERQEENRHEA